MAIEHHDVGGQKLVEHGLAGGEVVAQGRVGCRALSGGKMRIQWKSNTPPDWSSLLRAWREMEG